MGIAINLYYFKTIIKGISDTGTFFLIMYCSSKIQYHPSLPERILDYQETCMHAYIISLTI